MQALHIDLVRTPHELDNVVREFDRSTLLSLGIIDGRNIWRSNFATAKLLLEKAVALIGADRLLIAPSCSLQHVPMTLRNETKLDAEFKSWLAYTEENSRKSSPCVTSPSVSRIRTPSRRTKRQPIRVGRVHVSAAPR